MHGFIANAVEVHVQGRRKKCKILLGSETIYNTTILQPTADRIKT